MERDRKPALGSAIWLTDINAVSAPLILAVAGITAFFSGIANQFEGDDLFQIVNNPTVQSLGNIGQFFTGGTFYLDNPAKLGGVYYRPVMSVVYAMIYEAFGSNATAFHVVQFLLCIASSCLVYLVLRCSVSSRIALALALVFLLHPANSQVAFAIPAMQDALFVFFGMLAIWMLAQFGTDRSLLPAAVSLTISLFSKETGILFVVMAIVYLYSRDRRRLLTFVGIMLVPVVAWLYLKANAVGLNANPDIAPVDNLDLGARLMTAPSIMLFYAVKVVWPWPLASQYDWVHPHFTLADVGLPLVADLAIAGGVVYTKIKVRTAGSLAQHRMFCFFAVWAVLGLLAHAQLVPLDMTAAESWLYFPMVGILGMIGIAISSLSSPIHVDRRIVLSGCSVLLVLLGIRVGLRGTEWQSSYVLAQHDVAVAPDDFNAQSTIADQLTQQGAAREALPYARRAAATYPSLVTYNSLGAALLESGEYADAVVALNTALVYRKGHNLPLAYVQTVIENLGTITVWYGRPDSNAAFLISAVKVLPQDGKLWGDLAIALQRRGDNPDAKTAITNAATLGVAEPDVYNSIMANRTITIPVPSPSR